MRQEPGLANHTQHPRRPPPALKAGYTPRLNKVVFTPLAQRQTHSPGANRGGKRKLRRRMERKQQLLSPCLKSHESHYRFGSGARRFSWHQVTAICKTLPDHICLIMGPHFYLVLHSSQRATACPDSFGSLNNPIKQVAQVPTALATLCLSERCCQVLLCIWYELVRRACILRSVLGAGQRCRSREKEGAKAEVSQIWPPCQCFQGVNKSQEKADG